MIRIDAERLATAPFDTRAGTETVLSWVSVFGAAHAQRKLHDLSANYKCELAGEALKFWRQASKRVV